MRKVLFISADQWRGECLSALGHACVKTPHLDGLARQGTLFRNHYTQASPCSPARTSLLTGLYMMNHRSLRNGTPLDARHTNVALEARKAGYDPTLFGYTDTSPDPRRYPAGDPVLTTYEGVLPGMSVGLQLPDHMAAWIADLRARGYPLPGGRRDVYKPRHGYPGAEGAASARRCSRLARARRISSPTPCCATCRCAATSPGSSTPSSCARILR
jgi:arylsulfatase A-like enzyme